MGSPMSGVDSDVYLAASPSVSASNEAATNTDSGVWVAYVASVHKFWDKKQPLIVQTAGTSGGTYTTATDYTFEYAGGVILFNTPRVAGVSNFVRINAGYFWNLTELDNATTWSLALKADVADTTPFQSGGWARNTATIKKGTCKIDRVISDNRVTAELGNTIALQLYISLTGADRWDALGIISGVDHKSTAKGIVETAISVDIEGDCYLRLV